ncbi:MAG: glutathione S-transferase family protein [Polyangiales bacterium]
MTTPELFHFPVSHYNEKVRWALDFKRWPHRRTALVAGFHIPRTRWLTGQNRLPVLVLEGRALHDSTAIIAELERLRPEPALYPSSASDRARALALEDHFDEQVAPDLRRLFWSTYIDDTHECARLATDGFRPFTQWLWRTSFPAIRPAFRWNMGVGPTQVAAARTRLGQHIDRIEAEIGAAGYLVGDRFTIADLTAAAVMTAILRPPEFPYPLPEPWPAALVELRESIIDRPGCRWVLDIYRRHRGQSQEVRIDEERGFGA